MDTKLLLKYREFIRNIKGHSCFCILLLLLASVAPAFAFTPQQEKISITGKVVEAVDGVGLPGVNVVEKGTTNGSVTDANGDFTLLVSSNGTVVFSFVGYQSQEVAVTNQTVLNIRLTQDITQLQDIVVVGYGSVKKSDVTGSVVSLKSKDLTPGAMINVEQSLQGRVAGVQVYQTSGEPGAAMNVKIRGVSSITANADPLYVIDGMPVNNIVPVAGSQSGIANNQNNRNPLNGMNPNDIESIEVLKDASATAIYGSRGANGVILITTKSGSSGTLKINYTMQYGVQKSAKQLGLLNGQQYHDILNSIIDAGGGGGSPKVDDNYVNTDWQNEVLRTGGIATHDLSISGGKDNTKFYSSLGYYNQEGVMKNSGTERYTLRLNLENSVAKKYAVGINLNTSFISDKLNSIGVGINENGSALYAAYFYDPSTPVYDNAGKYFRAPSMGTTIDHPLALINGQYATSRNFRTFGSLYGEYFITPELSAKVRLAGDVSTTRRDSWIDPSTLIGLGRSGNASIYTGTIDYYLLESTLNYNKDFNEKHSVNAVLGATYENFGSTTFSGDGQGYSTPDLTTNAIGSGNPALNQISSGRASSKLNSYLGRVNYTFMNKYLLTASLRADGSSRFGQNNRFGYFPSAAVAWKAHEESFLSNVKAINELKVRVSYGIVGNQGIGNYRYMDNYAAVVGAVMGGSRVTGFQQIRLANPDLKWETSAQAAVGVDFALFAKRLTGTIEYWQRKTSDLLLDQPVPTSSGFASKTVNSGSMRNTGVDILLSGELLHKGKFSWSASANISFIKNEVLDLGGQPSIIGPTIGNLPNVSITKPGETINSFYGYQVIGVWQAGDDFTGWPASVKPGDMKFLDVDNNKVINANDRIILGASIPKYTYGFTTTWTYDKISLAAFFEGSSGGKILNEMLADAYYPVSFRRNRLAEPYLNRWTPENPTNEYPSFVNPTSQGNQQINSKSVESSDYIRLQSVQLSYNLPLKKGAIKNLRIFVTGQNLLLWTNYKGIDPAVNGTGQDVIKVDYSTYPMIRTFLAGVNIQL